MEQKYYKNMGWTYDSNFYSQIKYLWLSGDKISLDIIKNNNETDINADFKNNKTD